MTRFSRLLLLRVPKGGEPLYKLQRRLDVLYDMMLYDSEQSSICHRETFDWNIIATQLQLSSRNRRFH